MTETPPKADALKPTAPPLSDKAIEARAGGTTVDTAAAANSLLGTASASQAVEGVVQYEGMTTRREILPFKGWANRIVDLNAIVISLEDEKIIDDNRIQELAALLQEILQSHPECKTFVVNMGAVRFMNAAMIGKLILLDKKIRNERQGSPLTLRRVAANIMEVFKIMKLHKVFIIES